MASAVILGALNSNTTLVKVKCNHYKILLNSTYIQIQLLLKLNIQLYLAWYRQIVIQIQLLLKLNFGVYLKLSISSSFKYNSC